MLLHPILLAGVALLSAAVVRGMIGVAVLDRPNPRKAHARPVPKGGGVGIVAAVLAGLALLAFTDGFGPAARPFAIGAVFVPALAASVLVAAVAFLDDVLDWPFTVKLGVQLGAAAVAVAGGLWVRTVDVPGVGAVALGWLGLPLSFAWIVFATNAVNFIDGLNGLAAGTCLVAAGALAWFAAGHGEPFVPAAALLLGAGIAGFLPFNYPVARIFMGDVGSQFCGFLLAVLAVAATLAPGGGVPVLVVPMLLAGVLFDVAFTLARRALAGERVTEAHRGHLYQVAHRSGVPAPVVAAVHWAFAAWGGVCALLFLAGRPAAVLLVLAPQLAWLAWVSRRARRSGLGRW